jgi:hypothetical protein
MQMHGSQDGRIGGERFTGNHSGPKVHQRNRTCALPDCGVRLSIYNSSDVCALHESNGPMLRSRATIGTIPSGEPDRPAEGPGPTGADERDDLSRSA